MCQTQRQRWDSEDPEILNAKTVAARMTKRPLSEGEEGGTWRAHYAYAGDACESCGQQVRGLCVAADCGGGVITVCLPCAIADCDRAEASAAAKG